MLSEDRHNKLNNTLSDFKQQKVKTGRKICIHLGDRVTKCVIVIIERCKQLSFAPGGEDSDDLIITISLMLDLLMQYFGF